LTCGLLLCLAIAYSVEILISFDGKCGGFFPGTSTRRACSLWQYATGEMLAIAMVLAITYWPLVLMLLIFPSLIGYLLDRRQMRREN
jgi:hypothetical protein